MIRAPGLAAPAIDALYDEDYYLTDCEGHREFERTGGRKLSKRIRKCLELTAARPGERWLDIGCGRGELALHLAARGARVVGLDAARAAMTIARGARANWGGDGDGRLDLVRAMATDLPIHDAAVDGIVLSDIVEHLVPVELARLLVECRRVLRPRGRVIVHTQPNRRLVALTVPLLSRVSRLWGVRLPRDLREELTAGSGADYHPNEQTLGGLRRALKRAGLTPRESWLEGSWGVHRIFGESRMKPAILAGFRRSELLKSLLATQIFAVATLE